MKKIKKINDGVLVNPPKGADHSLKCIKLKIKQFCCKNFLKISNFCARPKNIFKSKLIQVLTSFSDCWIYIKNGQLYKKGQFLMK